MGQMSATSRAQATVSGNRIRTDFLESSSPRAMISPGSYMIHEASHFYVVDSTKKEYYEFDLSKMQASMAAMFKQMPGLQMKFSKFNFDAEDMGDGETMLGHPTRHWRVTGSMTMSGVIDEDTMAISVETTADHFFAKDIDVVITQLTSDSSAMLQFGDVIPGADVSKMRRAMARLPRGIDLKYENRITSSFGPMDIGATSTTRVTKIEAVNVDPSYFEVPHTYKKVEMPMPASPPRSF